MLNNDELTEDEEMIKVFDWELCYDEYQQIENSRR